MRDVYILKNELLFMFYKASVARRVSVAQHFLILILDYSRHPKGSFVQTGSLKILE